MGIVIPFVPRNARFRLQRLVNGGRATFVIIDPSVGIFPEAQSYLRELSRWRSNGLSTLRAVAYVVVDWCNHLRSKGLTWFQASPEDYLTWINSQNLCKGRLGRKNRVIWSWYRYLYEHPLYKPQSTSTFEGISLPTGDKAFGKPRYMPQHGRKDPGAATKAHKAKTIISDETVEALIEKIAALGDSFIIDRDSLIVAYEVGCGLRAIGISDIRVSSISNGLSKAGIIPPHMNVLSYATDLRRKTDIRNRVDRWKSLGSSGIIFQVTEKAGKSRDVMIRVDLLHQTLDFIWRYHNKWSKPWSQAYRPDAHLFLSLKSGQGLLAGTVSSIVKRYFNVFGLEGSGHDLRRHRVTKRGLELVSMSKKAGGFFDGTAIEIAMADEFGHDKFKTMGPYVDMGRILDEIGGEVEDQYKR